MSPRRRIQIAAVIMALAIWTFAHFSPLIYGTPWTRKHCNDAKWLKTWDFSCNDYFEDYSKYKKWTPPASHAIPPTVQASHPIPANNKGKIEAQPDVLTSGNEEIREKVEPGRDVFQAHPVDQINQSLEAALTLTGANAPLDPNEKKKLDEEMKRKEEAKKAADSEVEKLRDEVGPLLPSDLAKVEGERKAPAPPPPPKKEDTTIPIGEAMVQEVRKKKEELARLKKAAEEKQKELEAAEKQQSEKVEVKEKDPAVDLTAVEPAEVNIQTAPNDKRELDELD